jgi:hypothetical protein
MAPSPSVPFLPAAGAVRATEREHNRDEPGYDPNDPEPVVDAKVVARVEALIRTQTSDRERAFEAGGVPVSSVNFVHESLTIPRSSPTTT